MAEAINHIELAESRLAVQFKESTNLINYIRVLLSEADTLESVFQDLLDKRWIDTAEGVNLDIIGSIVGQPRELVDATILFYFGFLGATGAQSFGTVDDAGVGGRFKSTAESTTGNRALTDDEYRTFIRARISKNRTSSTVQELIDFIKFILDVPQIVIVEVSTSYTVQVGRLLTNNEKAFIKNSKLIPRTAGVTASYQEYEASQAFGFLGIPGSLGFGTISDPSIGGKFASII